MKEKIHPVKYRRAVILPKAKLFNGVKNIIDFTITLIAFVFLMPLFLLIALLIKLDSKGPIFFIQDRVGKNGKLFKFLKFRTMVENAEKIGLGLGVSKDDFRITRVGRFLREWTLDELPQFINILKGEMSLVGPRPLPQYPNQNILPATLWQKRVSVKPGLICLVDIKGRGFVSSWRERLELDVWYVENRSFWLDFKILFLGFFAVLSRRGVYGKEGVNKPPE
ncbi:MAG: sugar transferase [Patescibacteria group bacterium]